MHFEIADGTHWQLEKNLRLLQKQSKTKAQVNFLKQIYHHQESEGKTSKQQPILTKHKESEKGLKSEKNLPRQQNLKNKNNHCKKSVKQMKQLNNR